MKTILTILFILLSASIFGQSEVGLKIKCTGTDVVDFENIDQLAINELIMAEMGKAKGTKKLAFDTLLFKAAEFHGLYLNNKEDCGHYEPDFPLAYGHQDRIKFFINRFDEQYLSSFENQVDKNFVESAEICCSFTLTQKITYLDLVSRIMNQFKNSPSHWKIITQNMGNKKFFNAAYVASRPDSGGYKMQVVILLNYYNKKYSDNPTSIIQTTKEIQEGKWDKTFANPSFTKKNHIFNSEQFKKLISEYNKRKRLVN